MNVSLTPYFKKYIAKQLKEGRYGSASEVVRAALRALEARDEGREAAFHRLKEDIELGLADVRARRVRSVESVRRSLKARIRARKGRAA